MVDRPHLHGIVEVVLWGQLGPNHFLTVYADGLERFGYRDSPLEAMAYRLDRLFQVGGAPFSVEHVVDREWKLADRGLKRLRGLPPCDYRASPCNW